MFDEIQGSSILLLYPPQNAHAYVNAAFRMKVDPSSLSVSGIPSFVFGGITAHGVGLQLPVQYMCGARCNLVANEVLCSGSTPTAIPSVNVVPSCALLGAVLGSCLSCWFSCHVYVLALNDSMQ